jgi:hypothetical protein
MALALVLTLFALPLSCVCAPAGLSVALTDDGFRSVASPYVEAALKSVQTLTIPDVPNQKFQCAGSCYISASNIHVKSVACGQPTFSFTGDGATVGVPGCTVSASADWRLHRSTFPSASCSGGMNLVLSGLSITGSAAVGVAVDGSLQLGKAQVGTTVGGDSVSFSGDCKWLADLAKSLIKEAIKKAVNQEVGSALTAKVNEALAKVKFPTDIKAAMFDLDVRMAAAPSAANGHLVLQVNGVVNPFPGGTSSCVPLPDGAPASPANFAVRLGTCLFDSGLHAGYALGIIAGSIQKSFFGVPLTLAFAATQAPVFSITPAQSVITLFADAWLNATAADSLSLAVAIDFPISMSLSPQGHLSSSLQNITVDSGSLSIKILNGTWNPFTQGQLTNIITTIADDLFIPTFNPVLAKGIQLPAPKGLPAITWAPLVQGQGFLDAQGKV